jgi:hypothetical protein
MNKTIFTVLIFLISQCGSLVAQTDPNNDPNWDWKASSSYTLYHPDFPAGTPIVVTSPFYLNIEALRDNDKQDGWVLLIRNFGTSWRSESVPYFALYNKYQALLRLFVYTRMPGTYSDGGIELFFGSSSRTTALTFLKNRAYAQDKLNLVSGNRSLASTPIINGNWAYAEFPMSYDVNTPLIQNPSFWFKIWGISDYEIKLEGSGDLRQQFGENKPANISDPLTLALGPFNAGAKGVQSANATWDSWRGRIDSVATKISASHPNASVRNLRTSLLNLKNSWLISNIGAIGAGIGLVDFFLGGGKNINQANPSPMNFLLNFKLTGTMKVAHQVSGKAVVPVPGANHTVWDIPTNLLYTKPLGVLHLKKTPILQSRTYWQQISPTQSQLYASYRIKENLEFDLNPDAGVQIKTIEAAIVYHLDNATYDQRFLQWADEGKVILESASNGKYVFRSPYVNARDFQFQSVNVSPLTDVTIKVKAILTRNDATSGTQPVVFVATYEPDFENGDGVVAAYPSPVPTKPQDLRVTSIIDGGGESRPRLTWYPNGELNVVSGGGYKVWRRTKDTRVPPYSWSAWSLVTTINSPNVEFTDYGIIGAGFGPRIVEYKLTAYNSLSQESSFSDVVSINYGMPLAKNGNQNPSTSNFILSNNYPNPFNPTTTISYSLPTESDITISVFNTLGELVKSFEQGVRNNGFHSFVFDGSNLSSGVYFYKITALPLNKIEGENYQSFSKTKRMVLTK